MFMSIGVAQGKIMALVSVGIARFNEPTKSQRVLRYKCSRAQTRESHGCHCRGGLAGDLNTSLGFNHHKTW